MTWRRVVVFLLSAVAKVAAAGPPSTIIEAPAVIKAQKVFGRILMQLRWVVEDPHQKVTLSQLYRGLQWSEAGMMGAGCSRHEDLTYPLTDEGRRLLRAFISDEGNSRRGSKRNVWDAKEKLEKITRDLEAAVEDGNLSREMEDEHAEKAHGEAIDRVMQLQELIAALVQLKGRDGEMTGDDQFALWFNEKKSRRLKELLEILPQYFGEEMTKAESEACKLVRDSPASVVDNSEEDDRLQQQQRLQGVIRPISALSNDVLNGVSECTRRWIEYRIAKRAYYEELADKIQVQFQTLKAWICHKDILMFAFKTPKSSSNSEMAFPRLVVREMYRDHRQSKRESGGGDRGSKKESNTEEEVQNRGLRALAEAEQRTVDFCREVLQETFGSDSLRKIWPDALVWHYVKDKEARGSKATVSKGVLDTLQSVGYEEMHERFMDAVDEFDSTAKVIWQTGTFDDQAHLAALKDAANLASEVRDPTAKEWEGLIQDFHLLRDRLVESVGNDSYSEKSQKRGERVLEQFREDGQLVFQKIYDEQKEWMSSILRKSSKEASKFAVADLKKLWPSLDDWVYNEDSFSQLVDRLTSTLRVAAYFPHLGLSVPVTDPAKLVPGGWDGTTSKEERSAMRGQIIRKLDAQLVSIFNAQVAPLLIDEIKSLGASVGENLSDAKVRVMFPVIQLWMDSVDRKGGVDAANNLRARLHEDLTGFIAAREAAREIANSQRSRDRAYRSRSAINRLRESLSNSGNEEADSGRKSPTMSDQSVKTPAAGDRLHENVQWPLEVLGAVDRLFEKRDNARETMRSTLRGMHEFPFGFWPFPTPPGPDSLMNGSVRQGPRLSKTKNKAPNKTKSPTAAKKKKKAAKKGKPAGKAKAA